MLATLQHPHLTPQEYLDWESLQEIRYTQGEEIHLTSIDLQFPIEQLYEDITLTTGSV